MADGMMDDPRQYGRARWGLRSLQGGLGGFGMGVEGMRASDLSGFFGGRGGSPDFLKSFEVVDIGREGRAIVYRVR